MSKRFVASLLRWVFLGLLVGAGAWYAFRHPKLFASLRSVTFGHLAMLAAIVLGSMAIQGLQLRLLCSALGVELECREWFGLVMCGTFYSYLAPGRAGAGAQALYLKRRHALPFAHFVALFGASNLIQFFAAAVLGLVVCLVGWSLSVAPPRGVVFAFVAMIGISVVGTVFVLLFMRFFHRVPTQFLRSRLCRVNEGLKLLRAGKGVLRQVVLFRIFQSVVASAGLLVAARGVGVAATGVEVVTIQALVSLSVILPLTPGELGIREGIVSASGHLWGLSAEKMMLAALVRRGVGVLLTFLGGVLYSHSLLRLLTAPGDGDSAHSAAGKNAR